MEIELKNVTFGYYHMPVLQNISLCLAPNDCVALIGENGSGKTTLGKLCCGLLKPEKGQVLYDGASIDSMPLAQIGQKVGYLFQNPLKQIFAVTVFDELSFVMRLNRISSERITEEVITIAKAFEIEHLLEQKCHTLSRGESQRVALAGIFMRDPDYVILDEPTTGLDEARKSGFGHILEDILNRGVGVMVISHDQAFVGKHAHRVIEIKGGKVADR